VKLVALVDAVDHVCSRYRLAAFEPYLVAAGHTLVLRPLPDGLFARATLFRELRAADAVILQRKLLPGLQLGLLRRCARKLVFDYDDAVWLRDSYSWKGTVSRRRFRRFARTVRTADLVLAGNDFLATEAKRLAPNASVDVIPTCLDPHRYALAEHARTERLHLVWIGSSSTLQGLERIRPILDAIGQAIPGTRLKLICDRFVGFEHLAVEPLPWCAANEARDLASADIGITWIPDDDWSRGKCGLKVLQYQAAGLPVIANPVGVHPSFVEPGVSGFLANTPDDWIAGVRALADRDARARLGAAARAQLVERYSVAAGARLWLDALSRLTEPLKRTG
jgi:glycosyltransferase involved in cell wall biosynthesis